MGRRARKAQRKRSKTSNLVKGTTPTFWQRWTLSRILQTVCVSLGVGSALIMGAYALVTSTIRVSFEGRIERGYEISIHNPGPIDRRIDHFRILPVPGHRFIFKTLAPVWAKVNGGKIDFPGGNEFYVPAAEMRELDGEVVPSSSSVKLRIPPLSSRSWAEPDAMLIDVNVDAPAKRAVLAVIESTLGLIGQNRNQIRDRFVVLGNYWIRSRSTSLDEAIRIACRDDDTLSEQDFCREANESQSGGAIQ